VISLDPSTLDEVAASIETLAERLGVPERGRELAGEMRATIDDVRRSTRAALDAGAHRPRVFVAEWIDPPFVPGHWLPGMIESLEWSVAMMNPTYALYQYVTEDSRKEFMNQFRGFGEELQRGALDLKRRLREAGKAGSRISREEWIGIFGPGLQAPAEADLWLLAQKLASASGPKPALYLACGTEDPLLVDTRTFHRHLKAANLPVTYHESPGDHEWGYWDAQIQRVLEWLPLR